MTPPSSSSSSMDIEARLAVGELPTAGSWTTMTWTASAYIIAAVMGPGVLSLGGAMAQLGWVLGPITMLLFALVTWYASTLLADCYNTAPEMTTMTGKRSYTYMDAIAANLTGGSIVKVYICGFLQYANIVAIAVSHTVTASNTIMTMKRSAAKCYGDHPCNNGGVLQAPYMATIVFGVAQALLSQIPTFELISWLSVLSALMSLTFATIGAGLGIHRVFVTNNGRFEGSMTGPFFVGGVTPMDKASHILQALGTMAFSYSYSHMLFDIQDTIRAAPAVTTMRRANGLSATVTAFFYILCGVVGYAAHVDDLLLAGGDEPVWLVVVVAGAAVVFHLAGAYQVCCQPLFASVERWARKRWPRWSLATWQVWFLRLTWRTAFVVATTVLAVELPRPLVDDLVGLLNALAFWPLTIYFPVEMCIAREKVPKWSKRWVVLRLLSFVCFVVAVAAAGGCLAGIVSGAKAYYKRPSSSSGTFAGG